MQSPVLDQQLQIKSPVSSTGGCQSVRPAAASQFDFDRRLPVSSTSTGGCQSVRPVAASQFDWRLGGSQSV
jgi:hypothetical protein